MMSTSARAAALMTAALLLGSSATAATATAGDQVRTSTVTAGGQVRTSTVTAGEPVANSAAAAVTMTSNRKPKPAKGFHVVRELPLEVRAGFSPARGELWLATTADYGGLQLEHLRAGRWTTETVAVDGTVGWTSLSGTSRDDVWLATGASLHRYDGRRWTTLALPARELGAEPWDVRTVESPRKGVLYAAMSSNAWDGSSRVFRYAKGRWTALGAPGGGARFVVEMKVVDGALLTRSYTGDGEAFHSYVGGTWTRLYSYDYARNSNFIIGGWYPRSHSNHLLLGRGDDPFGTVPKCQQWIGSEPLVECTTTRATTASAQLKNGTIVMAEDDYYRLLDPSDPPEWEHVRATFGLRDIDGRETPLAGDPGEITKFVVAEAHRNAAWAVTLTWSDDTGYKKALQRYDG